MLETLNKYYEAGWLIKQTHPTLPLTIWNYSQATQYDGKWDEITLQCRGLVTDDVGNVVARPFRKFFNMEENKHTPTEEFDVFTKEDGSLGIAFNYKGDWIFTSRGSFTSEQAMWATEFINQNLVHGVAAMFNKELTYLFEVVYKENRIVVDYGDYEGIILLGAINTKTGEELSYDKLLQYAYFFDVVKKYDGISDYSTLKGMISDNAEGFVIRFSNGDRMKIKGEEYLRLHRIMTEISTKTVWECLKSGNLVNTILNDVPDEFFDKIKEYEEELLLEFDRVRQMAIDEYAHIVFQVGVEDRKKFAMRVKDSKYPHLMFAMLDKKDWNPIIWDIIKPDWRKL